LPKTAARGNREPKVTEERRRLLDEAIAQWYARPKQQKVRDVFVLYQRTCLEQHIQPVCERTFYRHVKQASGPALTEKRKGAKAAYTADQKTRKPKGHIGEPSPYRDQVGTVHQEGEATHCSFSGPIKLEAARWLESKVQEVQCSTCGSVSKAKLKEQSVVISPHPPRKSRPVRNVTRWMEQESDWVLVQKKE